MSKTMIESIDQEDSSSIMTIESEQVKSLLDGEEVDPDLEIRIESVCV